MRAMESGLADYSGVYNTEFMRIARRNNAARRREERRIQREREQAERERMLAEVARREAARKAEAFKAALESAKEQKRRAGHSLREIEVRICRAFGLNRTELRAERRHRDIVMARHAFFYWAARLTTQSLPAIGRYMDGRDHTTVLNGVKKYVIRRAAEGRTLRPISRGRPGADKR